MSPKDSDEFDNFEGAWSPADYGDDSYIPCPYCGETILEDAEHCPYCDRWISSEDQPEKKGKSIWVIAVILLLIAAFILSSIRF